MDTAHTAELILTSMGGKENVITNSVCMTRLRVGLADVSKADTDAIGAIHGVIGLAARGKNGIEVVFGPAVVEGVYDEFSRLTGIGIRKRTAKPPASKQRISPRSAPAATQVIRHRGQDESSLSASDVDKLRELLESPDADTGMACGPRLLVINGPNINLLGMREPQIYGHDDFSALLALCRTTGQEVGFSDTRCFQSNHEGDIVDEIQAAWHVFDAIVINPGAYTHTSVAILDALRAVDIPTVEVHISKVDEREDFRQVSYVRSACIETIIGEGIQGYRHAIIDLADYLVEHSPDEEPAG